jgi:fumarylacetoacetase
LEPLSPRHPSIDETHDPDRLSWVESANSHPDFPIQNLAHGVFSPPGEPNRPRGGVAIGDHILDLSALEETGVLKGEAQEVGRTAAEASLNAFMALPSQARRGLRRELSVWLSKSQATAPKTTAPLFYRQAECRMHLPAQIGDYTDFYAGIRHAENIGRLFRPDNPLLPNYKHVPIAYHGRASSIRPSGALVSRPSGQTNPTQSDAPKFGPAGRLDYEVELGVWISGGNALGEPIPIAQASEAIAGYCLLNDWSARDIQAWEYQPLGPFLSKSFATTLSPWLITAEALAPFRTGPAPREAGDPSPLPYLDDPQDHAAGALAITIEVWLSTAAGRARGAAPQKLATCDARDLYWTPAQMVAHHSSNGCNLRAGDLFGSGTISGASPDALGSLIELTGGGARPLRLDTGEERTFLLAGDEIILRGRCEREGFRSIGFGDCVGRVRD